MKAQAHWENICQTKAPDAVSWHAPHLDTSLKLIERAAPDRQATIIDVGGGQSTLVDDLVAQGYRNLRVLVSSTETHHTPFGTDQQFVYCLCKLAS